MASIVPRRKALCAEYGARKFRLIIFDPELATVEDRLCDPFLNARVGQWYSVKDEETERLGQEDIVPIDQFLKTQPGKDDICCKIAMPVTFTPEENTFYSSLISQGGTVLFSLNESRLEHGFYEAFISLTSFNAPIPDNNTTSSTMNWSIVCLEDVCGVWKTSSEKEKHAASQSALAIGSNKEQEISKSLLNQRQRPASAETTSLMSSPKNPHHQRASTVGSRLLSPKKEDQSKENELLFKSEEMNGHKTATNNGGRKTPKGEVEELRRKVVAVCWKRTGMDTFFIACKGEPPNRLQDRFQCNNMIMNSKLPALVKVEVGKWYTVEYSRYLCPESPHVRIFMLSEAVPPVETRVQHDAVQFNICMWRAQKAHWSDFCEVIQVPTGTPDLCLAWCQLSEKLKDSANKFNFVELIDDLLKATSTSTDKTTKSEKQQFLESEVSKPCDQQIQDSASASPDSITAEIENAKKLNKKPTAMMNGFVGQSDETKNMVKVYMQIKRIFHPWIRGPHDSHLKAIESAGVHIEFKLDSNDIVLSGTDRKIVDQFTEKLRTLRDERIRKAKERKCRVSTKMHGIIANGIDDLLEKTGAILVLPEQKVVTDSDILSIFGTLDEIEAARQWLCDKCGSGNIGELLIVQNKPQGDDKLMQFIAKAQQKSGSMTTLSRPTTLRTTDDEKEIEGPFSLSSSISSSSLRSHLRPPSVHSDRNAPMTATNVFSKVRTASTSRSATPTIHQNQKAFNLSSTSSTTLPKSAEVDYPEWQLKYLVGKNGTELMRYKKEVEVTFQQQNAKLICDFNKMPCKIHISGPSNAVDELCSKLREKIIRLNRSSVKDVMNVERRYHCQVIGKGGEFMRKLKRMHGVKEILVPSEFSSSELIRIEGPTMESVQACKDDLKNLIDNWCADTYEEIRVNPDFMSIICGQNNNKIRKLLENLCRVEVTFPPYHNGKMRQYDNDLIKIHGHRVQVAEFIKRLNEFLKELEDRQVEESIPIPSDDPNHEPVEFVKFVCCKKKQLEQEYPQLKLDFSSEYEEEGRKVNLRGPREQVEAAKQIVLERIEALKKIPKQRGRIMSAVLPTGHYQMQIPCDKRHHVHFLKDKAGLLAEIKQTYTKCRIELIKNTEQFELSGPKSVVEAAKAHIEQVISKMESQVRQTVTIPYHYHCYLGNRLGDIRKQFDVQIRMPAKGEDDIVLIGSDRNNIEEAEKALKLLCPTTQYIIVPAEHRPALIGHRGDTIMGLREKYSVRIDVPPRNSNDDARVSISGARENVQACIEDIQNNILPVTLPFSFPHQFRGILLGNEGRTVREFSDKYGVKIHLSNTNSDESTVTGNRHRVDDCLREIDRLVMEIAQKGYGHSQNVMVPEKLRAKLIGTNGITVKAMEQRHRVRISAVKGSPHVTVSGNEENCRNCVEEISQMLSKLTIQDHSRFDPFGYNSRAQSVASSSSPLRLTQSTSLMSLQNVEGKSNDGGCTII